MERWVFAVHLSLFFAEIIWLSKSLCAGAAGVTAVSQPADALAALCLGSPGVRSLNLQSGHLEKRRQKGFAEGLLSSAIGCNICYCYLLCLEKLTYLFFSSFFSGECVIWPQNTQLASVFCLERSPGARSISCQTYINLAADLNGCCLKVHVPLWFWVCSLQYPPSSGGKASTSHFIFDPEAFFCHQLRTAIETPTHRWLCFHPSSAVPKLDDIPALAPRQ